jgi:hypothetical protein
MKLRKFDETAVERGIELYDNLVDQYDNDTLEVLTYMLFVDELNGIIPPLYYKLNDLIKDYKNCELLMNSIRNIMESVE